MTDNTAKINGMRRAAQIFRGSALMMNESPQEMVSRGQMAKTLTDIADELVRQADLLEMNEATEGTKQRNNGPEQNDSSNQDKDQHVDQR